MRGASLPVGRIQYDANLGIGATLSLKDKRPHQSSGFFCLRVEREVSGV